VKGLYLIAEQHVNLLSLKQILRIQLVNDTVRDALLIYLAVVDILFHCVIGDEPIDKTAAALSIAIDTADGLAVVARVPRSVEHHHTTSADQVDPKTSGPALQHTYIRT